MKTISNNALELLILTALTTKISALLVKEEALVRKCTILFSIMIRLHCISVGYFVCVRCFLHFTARTTLQEIVS